MTENQARQLCRDAEKKLSSTSFLKTFIFGGNPTDEAIDMYTQASNYFKMAKCWKDAAETFKKIVELNLKIDNKYEAASNFINASNAYKQASLIDEAMKCLEEASSLYTGIGKFTQAAKTLKDCGEMLEKEEKFEKAIDCYQKAGEFYEGENQKSTASGCFVKVAHIQASSKQYDLASKTFEKCMSMAVDDRLLTFSSKEYLFKSLLCKLAGMKDPNTELENVKNSVLDYKELDVKFSDSRECKLIETIIGAFEEKDLKSYKSALRDYDQMSKFNQWMTNICLDIKANLDKMSNEIDVI